MITKTAKIVKRQGKFCVVSHKKDKKGHYRNFGCYDSRAQAKERLAQIHAFKAKKAELLDTIITVADDLVDKNIFHVADALTGCLEAIAQETIQRSTIIKLGKIVSILHKKGENDIADRLDSLLPEILCFENCECDAPENKSKMTADKVYKIAVDLENKYKVGLIGEGSFEFNQMEELKSLLKVGFLLTPPADCKELPKDSKNWWEHFGGK